MKSAPAQIVREYGPFPGVTDVHGVSHDGRRVWFATGDSLQSMDPASGKIVSIIKMTARAGTATTAGTCTSSPVRASRRSTRAAGDPGHAASARRRLLGHGLGRGALWVAHYRERKIHKIDPATGKILRTIASDRYVTGVTWTNGGLWHGTWENDESELRRVSPETGEVQESLLMPRASTSPGWKRATACSTAAAAPAAGSAPCASPSPRPKAAERTPPPEPGGGASGWRHGRPPLEPAPAGAPSPGESKRLPAPSARRPLGPAFRRASV